jgi:hypothetical protein
VNERASVGEPEFRSIFEGGLNWSAQHLWRITAAERGDAHAEGRKTWAD